MQSLSISELINLLSEYPSTVFGEDFFIMDFAYRKGYENNIVYPCKFEGVICVYCVEGEFDLTVGLEHYDISGQSFMVSLPGDIVDLGRKPGARGGKLRILAISERLLREMDFDLTRAQEVYKRRAIKVNTRYTLLIHHFRKLFRSVVSIRHKDTLRSLAYLLRSMEIELAYLWENESPGAAVSDPSAGNQVCDSFMTLVSKFHTTNRDIGFYASKLGLTPKYLSSLMKSVTGKTAAEWINENVMLEAKYYLKNTKLPVKQIAYDLSFKNQMDFYRYFQRYSGMTPTEYRNKQI